MNSLELIVSKLKKLAPLSLAGSWDNVGLLVEPSPPKYISKVMLTNDMTTPVVEEAKDKTVDLIISYHPPIFTPLKRLTQNSWKERLVVECMENRIAVFSPHTSHDAIEGGVNDWLLSAFDVKKTSVSPVELTQQFPEGNTHVLEIDLDPARLKEVRDQSLVSCLPAESRLRKNKEVFTMHPVRSSSSTGNEQLRLRVECQEAEVICLVKGLISSGCQEKYSVTPLSKVPTLGMGRKAELIAPVTMETAISKVKSHLSLTHVSVATAIESHIPECSSSQACQDDISRLALENHYIQEYGTLEPHGKQDSDIETVAVCAGSGSSVLHGAEADLLVTGEMTHHEVLDAVHRGSNVILCRHSNTERGYLSHLKNKLTVILGSSVEVFVSETDRDPLEVV